MTDQNETAVETVPEAAPKAAKPKASKKRAKKTAAAANGHVRILKPWRQVLGVLKRAGEKATLTRRDIADRAEKHGEKLINGRIASETKTYEGLVKAGFVKEDEIKVDDRPTTVYRMLAAGRKALETAKK